jgi:DNA-binding protein HU-beta
MNKAQFVELVQKSGGYKTKVEAETAIKAFTEAVTAALVKKEEVSLVGFGSFSATLQKGKAEKFQVPIKHTVQKIKWSLNLNRAKALKTA